MIIKRLFAFETNSSSCHSISITNDSQLNDIPIPDENGNISLYGGEFGWEYEVYSDFYSKAAYLMVYIRDWVKNESLAKLFKAKFDSLNN